jgi:predicted Holliday junction resolvase-like endonuclease
MSKSRKLKTKMQKLLLNIEIKIQDNRKLIRRLKFKIFSKKKSIKATIKFWNKRFYLRMEWKSREKKKRLDHWWRCSKLWMTKAYYKNACSTILTSKHPITSKIKERLSCQMKALSFKPKSVPSSGAMDQSASKVLISPTRASWLDIACVFAF